MLGLVAAVVLLRPVSGRQAGTDTPKGKWVPFVARFTQQNRANALGGPYKAETSGIFLRDSNGSWYRRMTVSSKDGRLPVIGQTDSALLHDASQQRDYLLDFQRKTIKVLGPTTLGQNPASAEEFEKLRADDTFLGKETVSGVECVVYGIHDPRHKGKYGSQAWYAPTLNFLVIKARSRLNDQDVTSLVDNIQAGVEPDPKYFEFPADFKTIK